jgi:ribosomal protein S18 acetylase RimI-like enzyme
MKLLTLLKTDRRRIPAAIQSVTFRQATITDLPGLEWDGQYRHFRRLYAETYNRVCNGNAIMWIGCIPGGKIIGQLFIQLVSSNYELADGKTRAYLFGFRVRDEYRSMGIGTNFLDYVEQDLVQRRYKYICLNVAKENLRALMLYERCGYSIIGPDPGLWSYQDEQGTWHSVEEPAWRMEKRLVPTGLFQ